MLNRTPGGNTELRQTPPRPSQRPDHSRPALPQPEQTGPPLLFGPELRGEEGRAGAPCPGNRLVGAPLGHLKPCNSLWGGDDYNPHFTDEKMRLRTELTGPGSRKAS